MRSILALMTLALVCCVNLCHAQPGLTELRASKDDPLVLGRSFDIAFSPLWRANQEQASAAYERYLSDHPQSELAPFLYYHLGKMFTQSVNSRSKRAGFQTDKPRASRYFQKSIESHPNGKISWLLCRARICFASLGDSDPTRIKRYAEFCEWLAALDRRKVSKQLWLPPDAPKTWTNNQINTFLMNRDAALGIAGVNLVSITDGLDASDVPNAVAALSNLSTDMPLIENIR